mgnify:CR=1 FL=1
MAAKIPWRIPLRIPSRNLLALGLASRERQDVLYDLPRKVPTGKEWLPRLRAALGVGLPNREPGNK